MVLARDSAATIFWQKLRIEKKIKNKKDNKNTYKVKVRSASVKCTFQGHII